MRHEGAFQALVADDEPLSRQYLAALVGHDPRFAVAAACANGSEAAGAAAATKLDVAFLDVRMPRMDGFQALHAMRPYVPLFVFVTAYSEYAVRAFEVDAADYVTKPIDPVRFARTLDRLCVRLAKRREGLAGRPEVAPADEAFGVAPAGLLGARLLSAVGRELVYRETEIEFVESNRNYVNVRLRGEFTLVRESLESFCRRLPSVDFVRVHRSYVVNMRWVRQLRYGKAGTAEIILADGQAIPVSRRSRRKVAELLRSMDASR